MQWEYIGQQHVPTSKGKISRLLRPEMWRASVPGGWLILTLINGELKSPTFIPDAQHVWEIEAEEAKSPRQMLLRPAAQRPRVEE